MIYASRVDAAFKSLIVAIDRTGAVLWTSHDPGGAAHRFTIENAAVTLANFDADPMAEVVIGGALLDHDGTVLWDQGGNGAGPTLGTNATYTGGIAAVADLDGDGRPEIITGKQAWRVTWNAGPPASATVTAYWTYAGADGYPAIADLDGDGHPEVVLTASAQVHVLDGRTGLLWCGRDPTGAACTTAALRTQPLNIPGGATQNRGGPPTIADFDGDGRLRSASPAATATALRSGAAGRGPDRRHAGAGRRRDLRALVAGHPGPVVERVGLVGVRLPGRRRRRGGLQRRVLHAVYRAPTAACS
ncbi:MAG: hypothetical protein IPH44_41090 [Myxococcales bacterium]|nr:hypothetical protein [Myxococcales bacterium]